MTESQHRGGGPALSAGTGGEPRQIEEADVGLSDLE